MSEDREVREWARIEELFARTAGEPSARARAILEEECADEPEIARAVESLLDSSGPASGFFDSLSERVFSSASGEEAPAQEALRELFDPLVGTSVGRYEIREPLGMGSMSHVYAGFDSVLQRGVALKFLPPLDPSAEAYKRFFVEARATAALEHENICNIHEIGETEDGRPFIVMALYEGETVRQRLKRGRLPVGEALDVARQACAGLAEAHAARIIHRDVKPGNLFVTTPGTVKVLDFGLAKLADVTLTGTRRAMGTLNYMSPEQTTGERVDTRTDVWSLGVVLYEMLTGELPFDGRTAAVVVRRVVGDEPTPPGRLVPDIPAALERAVMGALRKDRKRRTPTVEALDAELAACRTPGEP